MRLRGDRTQAWREKEPGGGGGGSRQAAVTAVVPLCLRMGSLPRQLKNNPNKNVIVRTWSHIISGSAFLRLIVNRSRFIRFKVDIDPLRHRISYAYTIQSIPEYAKMDGNDGFDVFIPNASFTGCFGPSPAGEGSVIGTLAWLAQLTFRSFFISLATQGTRHVVFFPEF